MASETEMVRVRKMTDPDRDLINVLSADERLIALREAGRRKVAAMNTTTFSENQVMLAVSAERTRQLAQTEDCTVDEVLRDLREATGRSLTELQADFDAGAAILETHKLVASESFSIGADIDGKRRAAFLAAYPMASEALLSLGEIRALYLGLVPRAVEVPASL